MKKTDVFLIALTTILTTLFSLSFAAAFTVTENITTNVVCPSSTLLLQQTVSTSKSGSFTITTSGTAKAFSTTVPTGFWLGQNQSKTIYTYITPSSKIVPGKYNIKITIESDGVTKEIEHDIVVENCHSTELEIENITKVCACEEKTITLTLTNKGRYSENYKLRIEGPASKWISLSSNTINLAPNSTTTVDAYIKTQCDVKGSYEVNFVLEAFPYLKTNKKATIEIVPCYDYTLSSEKVLYATCEAEQLTIPIKIKNLGTANNVYKINYDAPEWVKADQRELRIDKNEEKTFNLVSNPPFGTKGSFTIAIEVLSDFGKVMKKLELEQEVENCYGVALSVEAEKDRICNALSNSYMINVKNTGKFLNSYELSIEGPEWASLSNKSITLNASAEGQISLEVKPPFETKPGSYNITIKALDSISKVSATDTITIETINVSDCYMPAISSQQENIVLEKDSTATLPLIVENKGTNAANYSIEISGTASSFCQINPGAITLKPNEAETIYLYITPSIETKVGSYSITVTARLADTTVLSSKNIKISVTEVSEKENITIAEENVTNFTIITNVTNITANITGEVIAAGEHVEKQSLWLRFIKWLTRFFKKRTATTNTISNITNITITTVEKVKESTNHAPVLNKEIPDIELVSGKEYNIDLAQYFSDPDNDSLTYVSIKPAHIDITSVGSKVTLIAEKDFTGIVNTTFYAYDGKEITSSNKVVITVKAETTKANETNQTSA